MGKSIAEALTQLGVEQVRVEDGLDYADSFIRTILSKGYLKISEQSPNLWRRIYEGTDNPDLDRIAPGRLILIHFFKNVLSDMNS